LLFTVDKVRAFKYKLPIMRIRSSWGGLPVFITLVMAAGAHPRGQGQVHEGQYAQADIVKGQGIYRGQCATCHGTSGDAVGGVDLRRGRFRNARSDEDLARLISGGIPGTAMPAFKFEPAELTAIVAFIRAGFDVNAAAVKMGDAARGHGIFTGKGGCTACHRVNGQGPRLAPDLSDIGASRPAASIQGVLIDPATYLVPINRSVRAVTRDGKVITGRRLNEDTYTVQIFDEKEQLVSLTKAELKEYEVLKTPRMPSYKDKLTPDEIADLVAYLVSLKG
jgi:cytochrome c oxidase cbb3-type subunit III